MNEPERACLRDVAINVPRRERVPAVDDVATPVLQPRDFLYERQATTRYDGFDQPLPDDDAELRRGFMDEQLATQRSIQFLRDMEEQLAADERAAKAGSSVPPRPSRAPGYVKKKGPPLNSTA